MDTTDESEIPVLHLSDEELHRESPDDLGPAFQAAGPHEAELEELDRIDELGPEGQSERVRLYFSGCARGAWASFKVPTQAFPYTFRFAFVSAAGKRSLSGFGYHWRSYYAGATIWGRYPHALPTGTRQIYAYWWTGKPGEPGTGSAYWNLIPVRC